MGFSSLLIGFFNQLISAIFNSLIIDILVILGLN